ncbi:hypothetical protein LUZ61_013224 [Rhynchospora tenuis]|uniref:Protein kinase domain-containing protein n=1 Tax=Rhynchospora tenuis TaxID=198213 RepID=A0AAD5W903_9POAL|nr:hypothetical protein LUZ61_013224 [Rhynchospora tenuis]
MQVVPTAYTAYSNLVAFCHLLLLVLASESANVTTYPFSIAMPGCPNNCGGVPIPYPFGIGPGCYLSEDFEVSCNATNDSISTPYIGRNVVILDISLSLGRARINSPISSQCYNSTNKTDEYNDWSGNLSDSPYRFNHEKNKFLVIGCDTLAYITFSNGRNYYVGGCVSRCSSLESLTNGSCSGIGCCQTAIPKGTNFISVNFDGRYNNSKVYNFSRCGYALLMEDDGFTFNTNYISTDELYGQNMSVVIDWVIGNTTCDIAKANKSSYACISDYSVCSNSASGPGYLCNCSTGYQGNPYLQGGCQDIDECANENSCSRPGKCHNTQGGCCLEIEVPMLVYEFIPNGTLFHYIHYKKQGSNISLATRLKIAQESAEALAYLHFSASPPIFHGDVKSLNILLDQNYTAKVSDFGASILAPTDEVQFVTLVQGTCGYLDPEYMQSCQLTDKSDVYSFGVVLLELLTRKPAIDFDAPEEERSLSSCFLSAMKEDRMKELLDDDIKREDDMELITEIAELAKECLNMKGDERPTMKKIVEELDRIRNLKQHPWGQEYHSQETTTLLGETADDDIEIESTKHFSLGKKAEKNIASGR